MIKLAIIIIEHIKLFLHPVIINAFVFTKITNASSMKTGVMILIIISSVR